MIGVNSRALWYLTRGTGLVSLVLLTVTLALGVSQVVRFVRPGLPRFVVSGLHRNTSLVATVFLGVHIATAVLDTYAPIRIVDVFIPFIGAYRPFWLGLGALSFDLMLALVISSLLRDRIGLKAWRAVHWSAYACWPVALAHGLGTGSDTKVRWVLAVYVACLGTILASIVWRLATDWRTADVGRRTVAAMSSVAVVVAIGGWTVLGPLRPGWARTAGTPANLLGSSSASAQTPSAQTPSAQVPAAQTPAAQSPGSGGSSTPGAFRALDERFTGSLVQSAPDGAGNVSVTISGSLTGTTGGELMVILTGVPAAGGGISLSRGRVSFGPSGEPGLYRGSVTGLAGREIDARVSDGAGGRLTVRIHLSAADGSASVTGTVRTTG